MLAEAARDMTAYLEELDRLGFAAIDSPEPIAKALILLIHGAFRLVIDKQPLDDSTLSGIAHIADRAIFGSEVAPAYLAE